MTRERPEGGRESMSGGKSMSGRKMDDSPGNTGGDPGDCRAAEQVHEALLQAAVGEAPLEAAVDRAPLEAAVDEALDEALSEAAVDGRITCAAALGVARRLGMRSLVVGAACDRLGLKIVSCQLGCFGGREDGRTAGDQE